MGQPDRAPRIAITKNTKLFGESIFNIDIIIETNE